MAADVERLREQAQRIERLRREKERRDGRAISQETAAYEIGVSSRTYRTWEGSGATLKFDNLKALAAYYGTTTGYIERGVDLPTPEPLGVAMPDDAVTQLLAKLAAIEKELQKTQQELQKMQRDNETRALELRQRIDERTQPLQAPQRRRRA